MTPKQMKRQLLLNTVRENWVDIRKRLEEKSPLRRKKSRKSLKSLSNSCLRKLVGMMSG